MSCGLTMPTWLFSAWACSKFLKSVNRSSVRWPCSCVCHIVSQSGVSCFCVCRGILYSDELQRTDSNLPVKSGGDQPHSIDNMMICEPAWCITVPPTSWYRHPKICTSLVPKSKRCQHIQSCDWADQSSFGHGNNSKIEQWNHGPKFPPCCHQWPEILHLCQLTFQPPRSYIPVKPHWWCHSYPFRGRQQELRCIQLYWLLRWLFDQDRISLQYLSWTMLFDWDSWDLVCWLEISPLERSERERLEDNWSMSTWKRRGMSIHRTCWEWVVSMSCQWWFLSAFFTYAWSCCSYNLCNDVWECTQSESLECALDHEIRHCADVSVTS